MNGKLWEMRDTVRMQKIRIDYLEDMEKIKDLKESNAKLELEINDITAKLINEGKYEYEEIQKHLAGRQEYIDDLPRRKEGSKKWHEDAGRIMAYDRMIDKYRTGKIQGHFTGADMDEYRAKQNAEYDNARKAHFKKRDEKNKVKRDKDTQSSEDAIKRLKASGSDSLTAINDLISAEDNLLPSNQKAMTGNATDQKKFLKDTKSYLQDRADAFTVRTNELMIERGYVSTGIKQMYKEAKFKNDNFVDDHSMTGVVIYNGGDKKMTAIYEKQFNTIPKVGKNEIKEISIHANGEPSKRSSRRGGVTMGSWDNKGKVSMFHASGASRRKLEKLGITKNDFNLTGDHEFAHATWYGVKENIKEIGQSNLSEAMDKFNASVIDAYNDKNFELDSYTDTYRKGGSAGRMGREKDILENEVHSKLREHEKSGVLDKMENTANTMMGFQADYDKGGDIKARIEDKYGDMVSVGMAYGMTPTKAKFMQNMIKSYKSLRQEMYEI